MRLHDFLDEAQAQTGTVDLVVERTSAAKERIEDVLLFVGRNPRTAIGNPDLDRLAALILDTPREHTDPIAALRTIFHRVLDQVLYDVHHRHTIGEHGRQIGVGPGLHHQARILQPDRAGADAFFDECFDVHWSAVANNASRFGAGEAEHALDEITQLFALFLDQRAVAFHLFRPIGAAAA